ncbi:MAG: histidine--tRNA ligase [Elusimicrobiaceae bacterium]|nr:histidine--tRNA ligase [Elusimicrobiaceae bacterium]
MAKLLRGFRDLFESEAQKLTKVESEARSVFKLYGAQELRLPTLELKEIFIKATGQTTDIVQKEMYAFEDGGGRLVAMRPEGTPGVARAYIENNFQANPLQKFFYIGNMFRAERPQAGRYREFEQIGLEYIGNASPAADAEVILMLKAIFDKLGVKNYKVKINSIGCKECRPKFREDLIKFFTAQKDSLCEKCQTRLEVNPLRVLDCKIDGPKFTQNAPRQILCPDCQKHFDEVKKYLDGKVPFEMDPCLVRGLDYYTKTVFEFQADIAGAQNALAAGGRYDDLIASMGGPKVPAVGWALGAERVALASSFEEQKSKTIFVVSVEESANNYAFNILQTLRENGLIAEGGLFDKNLKAQMKQANKINANFALIIGGNEVAKNTVILKNLTSGEQKEIALPALLTALKEEK